MDPQEVAAVTALEGVALTALIVAQARALESARPDRLFDDPLAAEFVAAAGPAFATLSEQLADRLTFQRACVAIRTRFFDDCLLDAARAGGRQVVILGAGLDTRAFRLAWPPGVHLFELDRPDVLGFKQRVLRARSAAPTAERRAVRVDLREEWPRALMAAGFRGGEPTVWLAEGLLMYLTEEERDRLLDRAGALSSPGSRLAADHRGPGDGDGPAAPGADESPGGPERAGHGHQAGESPVARLGIRMPVDRADPSLANPAGWLAQHGWQADVYQPAEWFGRYGRPVPPEVAAGAVSLWLASARRV
jgi:methyltransferase (TIGR00027 family)